MRHSPAVSSAAPLLEDVSDTARWVAHLRSLEGERPDALFRDPFARRLAGERGRRIAEGMPSAPGAEPGPTGFASVLAIRTKVFDDLVLDGIRSTNADAVLNLAAGLDARPYRLSLPSSLVWIEADTAAMLEGKAALLASEEPACHIERIPTDLADDGARRALFDRVASSHARVVVVTEGLLVYLSEAVVRSLAAELRARSSVRRWILEAVAPAVLERNMKAWGHVLRPANAGWKFANADGLEYYRPIGWSPVAARSFFEEARRLGRPVKQDWILRLASSVSSSARKKIANMVVYGAIEPGSP
jgi:methyltransferase (TIGR00027 family)